MSLFAVVEAKRNQKVTAFSAKKISIFAVVEVKRNEQESIEFRFSGIFPQKSYYFEKCVESVFSVKEYVFCRS